jgi:hypothetical protein
MPAPESSEMSRKQAGSGIAGDKDVGPAVVVEVAGESTRLAASPETGQAPVSTGGSF